MTHGISLMLCYLNFSQNKAALLKSLKIDLEALERSLEIQDKEGKKIVIKKPLKQTARLKHSIGDYNPKAF